MQKISASSRQEKTAVVIPVKQELKVEALKLAQFLREAGVSVEFEVMGRKMAKALEDADKRKVDYAVIVGERELKEGTVVLRIWQNVSRQLLKLPSCLKKLRVKKMKATANSRGV